MQDIVQESQKIESHPGCVAVALCVLGNKWTALIVNELYNKPRRFSELEHALTGISPRTLSQRLDELEADKMITKQSFAEVPPRVVYTLTKKGQDLAPILRGMAEWGEKYSK